MKRPKVVIEGYLNRIAVVIDGWLDYITFSQLRYFLRRRRFRYNPYDRIWWKDSENVDEDLNELENFLIELGIPFVNRHRQYSSCSSEYR